MTPTVRQALAQCGLVPVDAKVLLAHVLGCNRAWLAAHELDALTKTQAEAFAALCRRRRDGEPVAYLTGTREFWALELAVTPDVLIPRPETENAGRACAGPNCRVIVRPAYWTWAPGPAPLHWRWPTTGPTRR